MNSNHLQLCFKFLFIQTKTVSNGYKCANKGDVCHCNGIVEYRNPQKTLVDKEDVNGQINCIKNKNDDIEECWCIPNSKFEVLTVL